MMKTCIDEREGVLLFPYELGLLSEDETEQFERHLLQCSYCHDQAAAFAPYAGILRATRAIGVGASGGEQAPADRSLFARFKQYLWPPVPLPLRPAVLIGLIVLLLYPMVSFFRGGPGDKIVSVPVLVLSPVRTATGSAVEKGTDGLVISVPDPGRESRQAYVIRVKDDRSQIIYEDESARKFDADGWRHLLFSDGLRPGDYRLSVIDQQVGAESVVGDYWFSVRE